MAVQQARLMTALRPSSISDLGIAGSRRGGQHRQVRCSGLFARSADQAIQVHGGNGLSIEYGLADLWFIARLHKTAPVSREMVLNFVAQHSLGLPKSY